jgi:hypothetical protein
VSAKGGVAVEDRLLNPLGHAQLTSLAAAASLPAIPTDARYVWLQAETNNVRWRDDGVDPTAAVGMLLSKDSDGFWYTAGPLSALKLIETTASAKVNVAYYR